MKKIMCCVLSFVSLSTFAAECLQPETAPVALSKKSRAFAQTQARNTWEDWIWRGPLFRCPANGTQSCAYQWSEAKTTGYSWQIGGGLNLSKIPVIGEYLSILSLSGNYTNNKSLTTTFGWTATIQPGWYAQPIQVIKRRWKSGSYRGAFVNTGLGCSRGIAAPVTKSWYRWDDNKVAGKWASNIAESNYSSYNIHR
ncbi:hypothetical protein GCM10027155_01760 [Acinetobacter apis]|uniref:Uncharacterized protein n=1 Tax=Acinetobacter apis TaxID=1229165 RepID=A0A217EDB1_9GAMM|nr:hypothetical protein [Acinetobacter apis]SNQ28262.1 hypothetical protein SAMN05444584_0176 [Acinetobacter apis]